MATYYSGATMSSTVEHMTWLFFFFQAEDGIRDLTVTGVQTCALPICDHSPHTPWHHPALARGERHHPPTHQTGWFRRWTPNRETARRGSRHAVSGPERPGGFPVDE